MHDVANTEHLIFPDFLKATPAEEGGDRFIYLEASNEARDFQGEIVLAKALEESAEYYKRYGNLDLDHLTQIGAKQGIADPYLYQIGTPVDVKCRAGKTWVKGAIFKGDTPVAAHANKFWDSLTKLSPRKRWFPSVGGGVVAKGPVFDPETRQTNTVVSKVRWTNIGFSATPVNPAVQQVSTVPIGVLAKSWGPGGLNLTKAMEAGYGTDSAALEGGAALRKQSLDRKPQNYWDFRDTVAKAIRTRAVAGTAQSIVDHAHADLGMSQSHAAEWTERFHADLRDGINQRKTH